MKIKIINNKYKYKLKKKTWEAPHLLNTNLNKVS